MKEEKHLGFEECIKSYDSNDEEYQRLKGEVKYDQDLENYVKEILELKRQYDTIYGNITAIDNNVLDKIDIITKENTIQSIMNKYNRLDTMLTMALYELNRKEYQASINLAIRTVIISIMISVILFALSLYSSEIRKMITSEFDIESKNVSNVIGLNEAFENRYEEMSKELLEIKGNCDSINLDIDKIYEIMEIKKLHLPKDSSSIEENK